MLMIFSFLLRIKLLSTYTDMELVELGCSYFDNYNIIFKI